MDGKEVLIVDLDGTLLKSDMLFESFWSALGRDWRCAIRSVATLVRGKAALKEYLRGAADLDVRGLPYDDDVIAYVRAYRQQGGHTALVTASNQSLAAQIAEHLQIFDEVHGSDAVTNLKGPAKASFLVERFGAGAFCYMGDAEADLPVWNVAGRVVTVNAPRSLRKKAENLGKPFEHLETREKSIAPYVQELRPHQWLKNILVFLPMLAAHRLDSATWISSILAFIAFSLIASSVYVLNDLLDLTADRAHPRKRQRPLASGALPIAHGGVLAAVLLVAGALLASFLGGMFLLTLTGYYLLTTAYSLKLKRKTVVDICILAGLYTMRIIAGGVATGIDLSVWLLAFSIFFFLSLAAIKRQAELVDMAQRGAIEARGRGYHVEDLPIISMVALAAGYVSVLVLALYLNSPSVVQLYVYPTALWGICCILLYWLTRMVLMTHRGFMHDDPVVYAAKDTVSQVCLVVIVAAAAAGALL
ncbi:UbiA family prenyltransferase [Thalassovita sp.]|uniref:UbiA family prenyltransferase n=1 Tax=Thalassovita sp. TaxID=1979401 RepID=UPI0029DE7803|nr:UbiA family prenyltransferase [Thalassovita sp.]